MRLTNYSDYALRSLMYLAVQKDEQALANISDIASSYDISKSHLTKIIHKLGQLGYIDSVRGKNGGIRLARSPNEINLGVLIRQIEPDFELVECFAANTCKKVQTPDVRNHAITGCVITPACRLKGVFFEALTAFIGVLEGYTLADIVENKAELRQLLG